MDHLPSRPGALPEATDVTIDRAPYDSDDARWVVTAAEAELVARYGFLSAGELGLTATEFDPPSGALLVARSTAERLPVGGVGLRRTDARIGEIKRLWVRAEWRGRGVARALMQEVEAEARRLGHNILRLETGDRQPEAIALYDSSGWVRQRVGWEGASIPLCSIHFAKDLTLS
jgi:GNAT superfamily N-acetyltransferase